MVGLTLNGKTYIACSKDSKINDPSWIILQCFVINRYGCKKEPMIHHGGHSFYDAEWGDHKIMVVCVANKRITIIADMVVELEPCPLTKNVAEVISIKEKVHHLFSHVGENKETTWGDCCPDFPSVKRYCENILKRFDRMGISADKIKSYSDYSFIEYHNLGI